MKVFVLCIDDNQPHGGIRKLYHHVDLLNQHGIGAEIVHEKKGFRCTWFENRTPVSYAHDNRSTLPGEQNVLVVPEIYGPHISQFGPAIPKVIFNQNCYYTFMQYSMDKNDLNTPYLSRDVVGAITVSKDSMEYLKAVFPALNVHRLHYGIDESLFHYSDRKRRKIAFMPRKNEHDLLQVINILKFRGLLADWDLVPIENKNEKQVAELLQEAMLFLSFGHPEGFGLPPAEAMACGAVVVGYHGMGGREFFLPEFSYPITNGDIIIFARTVEHVIQLQASNPDEIRNKGRKASEFILKTYTRSREESDILSFWKSISELLGTRTLSQSKRV